MGGDEQLDRLERELERDRADLAKAVEELKESLSFSGLKGQGKALLGAGKAQAAEGMASGLSAATQMVKDNPATAAASAAALGWVVTKMTDSRRSDPLEASDQRLADLFTPSGESPSDDEFWVAEVDRLRARAADLLETLDDAVARGNAPLDEIAERRAEVRQSLRLDTRQAMMRGLDGLDRKARDKAFRRREELYARHLGNGSGGGWVKPVALGAAVAGAGLAAAWLLPKTNVETQMLGEARDRAVGELKKLWAKNPTLAASIGTKLATTLVKSAIRRL